MNIRALSAVFAFGAFVFALPAAAQHRATSRDPVAYCRAVGTVDEPGAAAMAPGVPAWMRRRLGLRADQAAGVAWRCFNHRVLACVDAGGSAHCNKADTSRAATRDMREFCAANAGRSIPGSVTGSETIFNWTCAGRSPRIERQWARVDQRGFERGAWRDVTPRRR